MNPISDFYNRPMTTHYMSLKKQYLKYKLLTVIQCFSIHKDKIFNRELPIREFPLNQNGVRQNKTKGVGPVSFKMSPENKISNFAFWGGLVTSQLLTISQFYTI